METKSGSQNLLPPRGAEPRAFALTLKTNVLRSSVFKSILNETVLNSAEEEDSVYVAPDNDGHDKGVTISLL